MVSMHGGHLSLLATHLIQDAQQTAHSLQLIILHIKKASDQNQACNAIMIQRF
jgi:hypothetical protein